MSGSQSRNFWHWLGHLRPAARVCIESGIVAIAWAASLPLAYPMRGGEAVFSATVAAGICLLAILLAAPVAALLQGPATAMYAIGLAMLARTMLPLALGATLHAVVPTLRDGGMIYYLLAFYLLMLFTETVVSVAQIPRGPNAHGAT